jgi:protein SCO1/2
MLMREDFTHASLTATAAHIRHNAPLMSRASRIAAIACALVGVAFAGWWTAHLMTAAPRAIVLLHGTRLLPPRPIAAMNLVDQNGQRFTNERLVGRWSVVYFGFTNCPIICPTTMAVLKDFSRRVASLPASTRPQVILITVDPDRDTPAAMARYVAAFDPTFLGLTGKSAALDAVATDFSVAHGPTSADGSMDHSSTIYVVDPRAALAAVFTPPHGAAALAEDYQRLTSG